MADFSRLTPDQARLARRFLVIPSWLMAGSRYPFHFAANHPVRSALLAYVAAGEPGAPERFHLNKPINHYFVNGAAPWLEGIDVGDKTLRTGSLSPVNTPWELAQSVLQTARGKSNPFDFAHPTAWDSAAPLASTAVDFAQGGGVRSLERLVPGEKFVRQMIDPQASKFYPGDRTRLGRLERELGVIPIETPTPKTLLGEYKAFRADLGLALRRMGYSEIPKSLRGRLALRFDRAAARAKLPKDATSLDRFKADIALIKKHGWATDAEAQQMLKWARSASSHDVSYKGLRYLTAHYFDGDGMLSASIRYVNARHGFLHDVDYLLLTHQISEAEAQRVRHWSADASYEDLRDERSRLRQKYGHVPETRELKLPD
jgi:hypothetical protein